MGIEDHQFKLGGPGGPGRPKGSRNRLTEKFVSDLAKQWEESGPGVLKILAVESPDKFAALAQSLVPRQYDQEMPPVVRIITGVPRHGDDEPPAPQLPNSVTPLGPKE